MLFDLRGRGRRRTVQAIYLMLAILMGGGLVFFGIGGATSGGLFDAIGGNGSGAPANDIVAKRVASLEKRTQASPSDEGAWRQLASVRFQSAMTGANFDQTTGQFTDKGRQELQGASTAWQRYLALKPQKVDPNVANMMVRAYGVDGLQQYDKAVQAIETVIDARPPQPALYAQLSILAHGAGQTRKSDLAQQKAIELAPKDQRKGIEQAIQASRAQLDQQRVQGSAQNQGSSIGG
jgi:tetratricopeptide (TPR) repeat protein